MTRPPVFWARMVGGEDDSERRWARVRYRTWNSVVSLFIISFFLFVRGIYRGSDPLEHTSSHFAAFFLTAIVMVFAAYVVYHNRQKV